MSPELGHFALALAFCVSLVQAAAPFASGGGAERRLGIARAGARVQFLLVALSYAALTHAFVTHDFSVAYVASNSNLELPLFYRISAVWGAHEGSMLLWVLILAGWSCAVSASGAPLPAHFQARVLGLLGALSAGFHLFLLWTSNPFERLLPAALNGRDLNPLLQDPGMAFHPPMLYLGYVGLAVPFCFACAALLDGRLDAKWTRWTRPWTTMSWTFLTAGIALGSWWAYNELGWGGWWFWDPVENASFIPWLVATALLHSLAVSEHRAAFKSWTVLLAIFGFSASLLGAFLVRSGVLVSVHAFATDPQRGVYILAFLGVVVGGALTLYAARAGRIRDGGAFEYLSRETLLLVNNVLLVVVAAAITLGTLYPLAYQALGWGTLSIGPPWFNLMFAPFMLLLALLAGIGPHTRWRSDTLGPLARRLRPAAVATLLLGLLVLFLLSARTLGVGLALLIAAWVAASTLQNFRQRLRAGSRMALHRLPRGFLGMTLAHLGVAAFIVGATLTSAVSTERDVRLAPGESHEVAGYRFEFLDVHEVPGPNYEARRALIDVRRNGERVALLAPEKRVYRSDGQAMTEAAVDAGVTRDLYVALGEPLGGGAWALRIHHKPFVRWIWGGAALMALGGILAVTDRRYRRQRRAERRTPAGEAAPALR